MRENSNTKKKKKQKQIDYIHREIVPSKRSSKNTVAEEMARRIEKAAARASKLGFTIVILFCAVAMAGC